MVFLFLSSNKPALSSLQNSIRSLFPLISWFFLLQLSTSLYLSISLSLSLSLSLSIYLSIYLSSSLSIYPSFISISLFILGLCNWSEQFHSVYYVSWTRLTFAFAVQVTLSDAIIILCHIAYIISIWLQSFTYNLSFSFLPDAFYSTHRLHFHYSEYSSFFHSQYFFDFLIS